MLDHWIIWIFTGWGLLACIGWAWWYGRLWRTGVRLRRLQDQCPAELVNWPPLCVVVAAKDEADHIEPALRSLLGQDYPNLQIIAVNDRSTDRTGEVIDRLAAADTRLTPVHITELPEDWLGKVHALHCGSEAAIASGAAFILFCDADVHFAGGALKKAVALCEAESIDHLTLLPHVEARSWLLDVVLCAFGVLFLGQLDVSRVSDPKSSASAGVGAFNLVRAQAFARTEGFAWLRLEVADDLGLGVLMKQSGASSAFLTAMQEVWLEWYPSVSAMAKGLEKNIFPVACRFAWWRLIVQLLAIWMMTLGPLIAVVLPFFRSEVWWLWIAAGLAGLIKLLGGLALRRKVSRSLFAGLLLPVGIVLISAMMIRSAVACSRQGGIRWRDTFYPREKLLNGQRVKI